MDGSTPPTIAAQLTQLTWRPMNTSPRFEPGEVVVAADVDQFGRQQRATFVLRRSGCTAAGIGYWTVFACHSTPELASSWDAVLPAGTATPYPLVVCGELSQTLLVSQMVASAGQVPVECLDAVAKALATDGESVAAYNDALPFAGRDDPRRQFLTDLLERVHAITRRATTARMEEM